MLRTWHNYTCLCCALLCQNEQQQSVGVASGSSRLRADAGAGAAFGGLSRFDAAVSFAPSAFAPPALGAASPSARSTAPHSSLVSVHSDSSTLTQFELQYYCRHGSNREASLALALTFLL